MSCQQASRFITNNNSSNLNLNHNNSSNCKILNSQQQHHQLNNNTIKGNRNTRGGLGGGGGLLVVQQEDPYVFTESVPTTPPIFNTQKTRTRLNDLSSGTTLSIGKLQTQQQQQQKLPLTETNGKITLNTIKTQASFLSSISSSSTTSSNTTLTSTTNTCSAPTFKNNNVIQSLTTTSTTTATTNNNCNNSSGKKQTNVCIVRPQLQQQPHHQHSQHQNYVNSSLSSVYESDLKSISPPPLYTPPTPSLWQTPLLLESTTATMATGKTDPSTKSPTTTSLTNVTSPLIKSVTPNIQTIGNTSAVGAVTQTTNQTSSQTTTAMAKVAPIIVHTPSLAMPLSSTQTTQSPNQCLPPSKFHNHTLAQHLQKVECLKKSKKSLETEEISIEKAPLSNPFTAAALKIVDNSSKTFTGMTTSPVKHSENEDLNEIPVNVIFRMAMVPQTNEKSSNNIQFVKPQSEIDIQTPKQIIIPPPPPSSSLSTTTTSATSLLSSASSLSSTAQQQLKTTNVYKKLSIIPASKTITTTKQQQQINTSSIQQQKLKQNNTTTTALNSQPNNNTNPNNNEKDETNSKTTTTIKETLTKLNSNNSNVSITKIKNSSSTHISNLKTTRKLNLLNNSQTNQVSYDLANIGNWQMGCSSTTKGAVAIVKMSQHNIDLDTTHLATATGLPYCLQQYWLDANDYRKLSSSLTLSSSSSSSSSALSSSSPSSELLAMDKLINRSLAREERIAMYKQQLRRQAMQLLSTRSLQKLPIQVARRRLMCVDRLLRKYQQNEQNKKELPANVKRCCVNGCDAYTLELASHCQQHIVYNSAQHVFLPCTAKFADNTQCRVPVFDINHDLPLCMEHARKRDAYNRHLYEQRPRKISTNPITINESISTASSLSATKILNNKNMEGKVTTAAGGGILIKTQNYQQKQQQQNILQQLPTNQHHNNNNNNNGNKRPTLVNQQQSRKRKMTNAVAAGGGSVVGFNGNPVGRPQKRVKKTTEKMLNTKATTTTTTTLLTTQMPRLTTTNLKRKSSTTSLESIASNSQHSTASSTSQQQQQQQPQQQYQRQQPQQQQHLYGNNSLITNTSTTTSLSSSSSSLPPPALAPLSGSGLLTHNLPQHLFSFGHDNHHSQQYQQQQPTPQNQQQQQLQPLNITDKHSFIPATASSATTASTPTELKDFITQFSLLTQKQNHQTADIKMNDVNLLNTNSNSNFTSSGMGSTTSLPTADDFLTQDMLSICENSSASSADTGLGGLSDPELMLGGPEDDIPLGDTHLLEEHDLENVLNSLPEDAFKELFTTVHQDESDEIERAIELADKHLKTLQQTIGSELGDFLDFNDDMLMDNGDLCNGSTTNTILDTSALFIGGGGLVGGAAANATIGVTAANPVQGGGSVIGTDIRGLVQT